mgnify:CR=1 FL=1|tara:strand:+ start:17 stop:1351 length:1335 start_codon:yes stop_codon:yes gene_type:complete
MQVIDYKKINIENIIFKDPITVSKGCKIVKTYYNHNNEEIPIYIQTPKLRNISELNISDLITFIELELDKKHINFYEFINNIDDKNISQTHLNSENWFNKKLPMDVIDDFYKTNIKMKNFNKSPIMKLKIQLDNEKNTNCDIFGEDLTPIKISEVKKNMDIICILELQGIKFYNQKFETEWNIIQLRTYRNKSYSQKCLINESFLSDNEEEIDLNDKLNNNDEENLNTTIKNENKIKNIEIKENKDTEKTINEIIKLNSSKENLKINISKKEDVENKNKDDVKDFLNDEENLEEQNNLTKNLIIDNNCTISNEENNEENNNEKIYDSYSENETDNESNADSELSDIFSDNFSDEEEICNGLENNLQEINFSDSDNEDHLNNTIIEEKDLSENVIRENINKEYENKSISELLEEINKLKKIANEKDEQVKKLKNKYKNLYCELNL